MSVAESPSLRDVALVIPAYNEGSVIRETITGIPERFPHVICVDDGSRDDTRQNILSTRATAVSHPINLGQGAALQTGIEVAMLNPEVEFIVTYDADGQHQIADVEAMCAYMREHPDLDILLGSRFLGAAENITATKRAVLRLAVLFSNLTTGLRLTDAHNGLRVIRREAARRIDLQVPDFGHASEIIERIKELQLRYEEFPVTIVYTEYSRAKGQSMFNAINLSFDALLRKAVRR